MASLAVDTDVWKIPARTTRRVLFACWLAILAEGYDVGVLGAILPALAVDKEWALTPLQLGGLGSYALVGMLFGALFIGTISDIVGRKKMILLSMLIFTLTQAGAAMAPTPEIFGLFRFLGGLGMGGIIPVAAAMTIEYSAPKKRAFNYGIMYSGYSFGIMAAAIVGILMLPTFGWRGVIVVGASPVIVIPIIALLLPESLDFLIAKNRIKEARALAAKLGIKDYTPQLPKDPGKKIPWKSVLGTMFSKKYLRSTVFFWLSLFGGMVLVYGLTAWLPQIMRKAGYDLGSALTFLVVFSLASAVGGLVLGRWADKYGAKIVLVSFYLVGAAGILLLMFPNSMAINLVFVGLAGIGSISTSLVLTAYIADYYPAATRATATGWALSFARLGAISGPIIGGWVAGSGLGIQWNFIIFALVGVLAAVAVSLIPKRVTEVTAALAQNDERIAAGEPA